MVQFGVRSLEFGVRSLAFCINKVTQNSKHKTQNSEPKTNCELFAEISANSFFVAIARVLRFVGSVRSSHCLMDEAQTYYF